MQETQHTQQTATRTAQNQTANYRIYLRAFLEKVNSTQLYKGFS